MCAGAVSVAVTSVFLEVANETRAAKIIFFSFGQIHVSAKKSLSANCQSCESDICTPNLRDKIARKRFITFPRLISAVSASILCRRYATVYITFNVFVDLQISEIAVNQAALSCR